MRLLVEQKALNEADTFMCSVFMTRFYIRGTTGQRKSDYGIEFFVIQYILLTIENDHLICLS